MKLDKKVSYDQQSNESEEASPRRDIEDGYHTVKNVKKDVFDLKKMK